MKSIEQYFNDWANACLDGSEDQKTQRLVRMAFHAGAISLLGDDTLRETFLAARMCVPKVDTQIKAWVIEGQLMLAELAAEANPPKVSPPYDTNPGDASPY